MRPSARSAPPEPTHPLPFIGGALTVVVIVAFIAFIARPSSAAPASPAATNGWQTAQGIGGAILQVAFSHQSPKVGYASVFVDKSPIAVYRTSDEGAHWGQTASLTTPLLDLLAVNPTNPRDLALLPSTLPGGGTYTIQRSLDSGKSWAAQSATLADSGTVAALGWANDALLVGLTRDAATDGGSHLLAFPAKGTPTTLDSGGNFGGIRIDQIRYVHGAGASLTVVGVAAGSTDNAIALAGARSADHGATWAGFSFTQGSDNLLPLGAAPDGQTILSVGNKRNTVYLSRDAGRTWHAEHAHGTAPFDLTAARPLVTDDGAYFLKLTADLKPGQYSLQYTGRGRYNGDRDLIALSDDGAGRLHRLWAVTNNTLVWLGA
jgi:hypothetical protein